MTKKDLTAKFRMVIVLLLQNGWKLAGWKLWLALKIWDYLWHVLVWPLLEYEIGKMHMQKKIKRRQEVWERAKTMATKDDFLKAVKCVWKQNNNGGKNGTRKANVYRS